MRFSSSIGLKVYLSLLRLDSRAPRFVGEGVGFIEGPRCQSSMNQDGRGGVDASSFQTVHLYLKSGGGSDRSNVKP